MERFEKIDKGLQALEGPITVKLNNVSAMECNTIRHFFQGALNRFYKLAQVSDCTSWLHNSILSDEQYASSSAAIGTVLAYFQILNSLLHASYMYLVFSRAAIPKGVCCRWRSQWTWACLAQHQASRHSKRTGHCQDSFAEHNVDHVSLYHMKCMVCVFSTWMQLCLTILLVRTSSETK